MSSPDTPPSLEPTTHALLDECRDRMLRMYPATIRECLGELSDEQVWWRPNEASNSVGNLVLHLAGNLNHYVGRGIVGTGYERDRPAEFDEKGSVPRAELLARLESALDIMKQAFDSMTPERLLENADLGKESQPVGRLLISVTTHFNGHVGQIVYVTKMLKAGVFDDELWRRVGDR